MRRLLIIALLVCWAVPAAAQPSDDNVRLAEAHYKQGEAFFAAKDFRRALSEFQAAYKLAPEPLLLFNMGLCFRQAGRKKEALDHFKRYVEAQPQGDRAGEASEYIAALTKELDAEAAQAEAQRQAREAAKKERERKQAEEARQRAEQQRQAEAERERQRVLAAQRRRGRVLRIAGLVTAGVGVVGLGLGGKFGFDARSIDHELSTHTGAWTDAQLARASAGKDANTNMIIAASVGGALVIGGAVLYWRGAVAGHQERPAVSLAPAVSPGLTGVAVSGWF